MFSITYLTLAILLAAFNQYTECQRMYQPFSCQRTDSPCFTGTCLSNGTCLCSRNGLVGYKCALSTSVIKTTCGIACENGGTCYFDGQPSDKCFCAAGFSGFNCDRPRVQILDCQTNSMTVLINPNSEAFTGKIYVKGQPSCNFSIAASSTNPGYSRVLNLNASDSCASGGGYTETIQNGTIIKSYKVVVQYSPLVQKASDEEHTFNCGGESKTGTISLGPIIPPSNDSGTNGIDVTVGGNDMTMTFTNYSTRQPVSGAIILGTELYMEASSPASVSFFRMTTCTATGQSGGNVVLVRNSCITSEGKDAGVQSLARLGNTVLMHIKVFRFSNDITLNINCQFNMCTSSNDTACTEAFCGTMGTGFGRRKREIATPQQHMKGSAKLYVVDTVEQLELLTGRRDISNAQCYQSALFIAFACLLGCLLMMALVLVVVVCVRLRRHRCPKQCEMYSNDAMDTRMT